MYALNVTIQGPAILRDFENKKAVKRVCYQDIAVSRWVLQFLRSSTRGLKLLVNVVNVFHFEIVSLFSAAAGLYEEFLSTLLFQRCSAFLNTIEYFVNRWLMADLLLSPLALRYFLNK